MDIEKSYAKLYEFVQKKRKYQKNDPTMITPGYEPKLTLNFHYVDITYVPMEALLIRQRQEKIRSRVKAVDIPKDIQPASFGNFECTDGRGYMSLEALDFVEKYAADSKRYRKGPYLVGGLGIGGIYLLETTARKLAITGFIATLVHFLTFAVETKQAIGEDQVAEKLNAVRCSSILMTDDIGVDMMSNWIRDEVSGVILQYRMQEQLPTSFSSNSTMGELEQHLPITQHGDEEPLKTKQIVGRIHYLTKEIEMTGRNRRND